MDVPGAPVGTDMLEEAGCRDGLADAAFQWRRRHLRL